MSTENYSTAYNLRTTVANWYIILRNMSLVALLSILVYVGIRIMISSTATDKSKYKQMLMDWVVAICLLFVLHYIMAFANLVVKKIIEQSRACDYIIAPIADNRMFQIINAFIDGEITDEQCKHCLAATNLGMQYIFISERAVSQAKILERCYISANEREYYKNIRLEEAVLGDNKVKLARRQYRGKGQYIDDILGE